MTRKSHSVHIAHKSCAIWLKLPILFIFKQNARIEFLPIASHQNFPLTSITTWPTAIPDITPLDASSRQLTQKTPKMPSIMALS